ncbi:conserved hypothetical protein [uncultured Desulfatiglans sp.]|uniref:Uncharacterized protein n=1 Tax=Uncultured Desulfatiglans sp. TaxID=1748965 RepID=A0A653AG29_UNCDX|nr:conserved hypothetical protein [uncultured Desulfatiglans sp.]
MDQKRSSKDDHAMGPTALVGAIRAIYRQGPEQARTRIEAMLTAELGGYPYEVQEKSLADLTAAFLPREERPAAGALETTTLRRVVALILGREPEADMPAEELVKRLAESVNKLFDLINEVVRSIDLHLAPGGGEETIRHVIGSEIAGAGGARSIEGYLGQIKRAFMIAQEASKRTAVEQVGGILQALDPEALSKSGGGGLRFGPLRKAELFGLYEEHFRQCRQWFESNRFMEDWIRGFERNCAKITAEQDGGSH